MVGKVSDGEKRKQIVDRSRALFLERGFSALSMEEIASLQGISKKTLYRYFPNKAALSEAAIEERILEVVAEIQRIADDPGLPLLRRLRGVLRVVSRQIAALGENLVKDLYYHYPELWERIDRFRRERVFGVITRLFEEGIREGYFRRDIEPRLVPVLFINAVSTVMTPAQLVSLPFPPVQLFDSFFRILFGGILTDDARHEFFSEEGAI
ncbi:MAG TPA: TetR/AcrR family transcriptional regulator, partial [Spirochaetia bacterium]|nr:TetR/AcrR family transcriptional regulator [Spirochaetia bacterium]